MKGLTLLAAVAMIASACGSTAPAACIVKPATLVKAPSKAVITLVKAGTITIALRPDKAPNTVTNFANVALSGCYDGLTFHRVVANFVAQGGDPEGTGSGGGQQRTELTDLPFVKGAVGVARANDINISNRPPIFHLHGRVPAFEQPVHEHWSGDQRPGRRGQDRRG
ncbi:MAG TPA: peptidylprolyl isomerase [Candidatus Limnocylindria bacterium]|nr:peptidylprolyl isomerase [Candidatus Limnocylindria bacterium]